MKNENLKTWLKDVVKTKIEWLFKKCPHNVGVLEAAINKYYKKLEKRKKKEEPEMDEKERS